MGYALPDDAVVKFRTEGYVVLRDFFEAMEDLSPFVEGYTRLVDALATIYIQNVKPGLQEAYSQRTFPERIATLFGVSGGTILYHFIPNLIQYANAFYRSQQLDLPSAQIPELFYLMRNTKLIDAIECLIGPEISVSPSYQINFKLARKHLDLVQSVAHDVGKKFADLKGFYDVYVEGATALHTDARYYLPEAHDSDIVVAWIPMTAADIERGSLVVVPGSHRSGVISHPFSDEIAGQAVPVETQVGDLVLFHHKLIHGSLANESMDSFRWSFNFRYHPTGQPSGRPFLPGFRVRSRAAPQTELHNPLIWSAMWQAALRNLATTNLPLPPPRPIDRQESEVISTQWKLLVPHDLSWLRLG